jgi:capsular polysaccharide biosynthesis protein
VELKAYLDVLRRRWPAVVAVPLIVALLVVVQEATRQTTYSATARASVVRERDPLPADRYAYDTYYNYLASEFAIDDLVESTSGNVFADAVAGRVQATGMQVSGGEVLQALSVSRKHRVITYTLTSSDPAKAKAMAAEAVAEWQEHAFNYVGEQANGQGAVVDIVQRPDDATSSAGRAHVLLAVELVAAVLFGVLLAFFVHYLDDTLYDAETTATALRLPHLASVPLEPRR